KDTQGASCLNAPNYKSGLASVSSQLVGKQNVLFDLQNELDHPHLPQPDNVVHPAAWTVPEWQSYLASDVKSAVHGNDATRLVTVSWTSDYRPEGDVFNNVQNNAYDILAYHYRCCPATPSQ